MPVLERLRAIAHDLPTQTFAAIQARQIAPTEQTLLQKLGYIDEDQSLFHPLLSSLIPQPTPDESALSPTERRVLEYLRVHAGELVARDDIARIVWGEEEWQDKYSDWAIGQLVYRLRRKMAYSHAAGGTIETRKKQGFVFSA